MMLKRILMGLFGLIGFAAFVIWMNGHVVTAETSAVLASEWSGFKRISNSGQKASVPSLAIQSNGTLHAAFEQGTPNEDPYYVTSVDGVSWTTPQVISTNSATTIVDKVDIAVANNGIVHAAWIENNDLNDTHSLMYASRSGSSWSAPEAVEVVTKGPTTTLQQPSLLVDGGRVFIVWTSGIDVQFASRNAGTWTPTKIGEFALPEIAIDSNGTLHVAFLDDFGKFVVQYIQSTDSGATWSTAVTLSPFSKDVQDVDLTVDGTTVHIAYGAKDTSSSPSVPYYTTCSANCSVEASWPTAETITGLEIGTRPADAILLSPSIAVDDHGYALVFFHGVLQENLNFEQVVGACYDPLTKGGRDFKLPTAFSERMVKPQTVYVNGDLHVVYEQIRGQAASTDFQEIHYAKLDVSCFNLYLPLISK
ncbi:MAG: WD40/YVTN/BNR-like repeat-containing protein [Anaerolineae bacterium]